MRSPKILVLVVSGLIVSRGIVDAADPMNTVAERYAHLVLALGQHDQEK